MNSTARNCQECAEPIRGRTDKKFCSDQCRVTFNNRLHSDQNNYARNVNNLIRRNRRILATLNTRGSTTVSRRKLYEKGFDFGYFTNTQTKDGAIYYYCYEQGYLPTEDENYLLVVKEDYRT